MMGSGSRAMEAVWPKPDAFPDRPDSSLHVWRIVLSDAPGAASLLSPDETGRAERLRHGAVRQRFVRARTALRRLLGRYLEVHGGDISFVYGPAGKPAVEGDARLAFNLSHSGGLALCAVSGPRVALGVDIEAMRTLRDAGKLAERHFSPAELNGWSRLSEPERLPGFYRVWTRKEALLKAAGEGLARPLERVDSAAGDLDGRSYWLESLEPDEGYAAAVASTAAPSRVRCWTWPG